MKLNLLSNQNHICPVNQDPRSPAPANISNRTLIFQGQDNGFNLNTPLENDYFST